MFLSRRFPVIFVILLVIITAILGIFVIKRAEVGHGPISSKTSPEVQVKTYQDAVQKIISDYLVASSAETSTQKIIELSGGAETALLSLAVPTEFQNAHLELVLIFHDGNRVGQLNPGATLKNKVENFWKKYSWAR
ncbi:MAG: hypothetical protein V1821_00810 [bacterium]